MKSSKTLVPSIFQSAISTIYSLSSRSKIMACMVQAAWQKWRERKGNECTRKRIPRNCHKTHSLTYRWLMTWSYLIGREATNAVILWEANISSLILEEREGRYWRKTGISVFITTFFFIFSAKHYWLISYYEMWSF